ncbi:penicillin-insensitive murein endopeptidase [Roseibium aggregatum]|uniref:Penicillin-insensitive murein endopeptidase n=1 Tax=Roseibium aggregatum TaxID=187304 RepID=A0A926NQY3_9HYPH|nr:penicillin-insensitive murein endopeptidase [Roseibium aggregatum]MBD1544819.1 penicillin-insensitive murein endopeptidase [Roseibium aggregatum]
MTTSKPTSLRLCRPASVLLRRVAAGTGLGLFCLSLLAGTPAGAVSSPPPPAPKPETNDLLQLAAIPVPRPKAALSEEGEATPYDRSGQLVLRGDQPAKFYFGAMKEPAHLEPDSIGSYAKGCLAGAEELPVDGKTWQVMRLSRNRNWGNPVLINFLEDLANDAPKLGWRGLLVGDIAQPRGGPMTSGHASHQIGLDADIWLTEMPDHRLSRQEREDKSAISMLKGRLDVKGADRTVDPKKWTDARARLIKRAASDKRVARIFVNPAIKKALCDFEKGKDRSWLRTVRPWWGHHYHFHVRLACPKGDRSCKDQNPPPPGDGCGKELTWWLSDEPWVPKKPKDPNKKVAKKKPIALAALPKACENVLTAN